MDRKLKIVHYKVGGTQKILLKLNTLKKKIIEYFLMQIKADIFHILSENSVNCEIHQKMPMFEQFKNQV